VLHVDAVGVLVRVGLQVTLPLRPLLLGLVLRTVLGLLVGTLLGPVTRNVLGLVLGTGGLQAGGRHRGGRRPSPGAAHHHRLRSVADLAGDGAPADAPTAIPSTTTRADARAIPMIALLRCHLPSSLPRSRVSRAATTLRRRP